MTTLEILKAARAKIAAPGTWTRGAAARDEFDQEVEPNGPDAVCWCAAGAICAVLNVGRYVPSIDVQSEANDARAALVAAIGEKDIGKRNDGARHDIVLGWYDDAIRAAENAERAARGES